MDRKIRTVSLVVVALVVTFIGGAFVGAKRTADFFTKTMAVSTLADLSQMTQAVSLVRTGETDRLLFVLNSRVGGAVGSVCAGSDWLESLERAREVCAEAAEYYRLHPPKNSTPHVVAMLEVLESLPDVE